MKRDVVVVGAGPGGTLAALLLARLGHRVTIYERRPDLRTTVQSAGRSINLALANRGLKALRLAGVEPAVDKLLTVMRGRMVHHLGGDLDLQAYGQRPHEVIYSVSRPGLNAVLLDAAEAAGVHIVFNTRCSDVNVAKSELELVDEVSGAVRRIAFRHCIASDGAGSVIRAQLMKQPSYVGSEQIQAHGYKELSILADSEGRHRMDPNALHIWPRGGYMLIALPNVDGSFTVTLFLANAGEPSFRSLRTPLDVREFFEQQFPDVIDKIHDLEDSFFANPTGLLGTVRCHPWNLDDRILLLGDAAHAIVPFYGQGMNCALEDCIELDRCVTEHVLDWNLAFRKFSEIRKPNADAIADMAQQNYIEMRDSVRDPDFLLRQAVGFELQRRWPDRFCPRYSMVMFRDDLSYEEALRRGEIQEEILLSLTKDKSSVSSVDYQRAAQMLAKRLTPLPRANA